MADSYYKSLAPYYDIMIDWNSRLKKEIPFIASLAGDKKPEGVKVLDIGCGTGKHLKALNELGFKVYGMEPSSGLREEAKQEVPDAIIHPGGFESLQKFSASHGPWDLIYCIGNTLSHLKRDLLPDFFTSIKESLTERWNLSYSYIGIRENTK